MGNVFRNQPFPTRYEPLKTPVTEDTLQIGLLFAFGIIAVSFLAILPGIRGWERLWAFIRVFVALWIGAVLLVCNFGSWYADSVCTRTDYKAHTKPNSPQIIQAVVGISISLRGINVTLAEMEDGCGSEDYERPFPDEMIYYVESFRWAPAWGQGRLDYGIYGGQFQQRYREAQYRGMPKPILRVAESFLIDGEQYRWYRKFRTAGWYTHIWLWCGFATYLLSIIIFIFSVRHGAYFLFLTGSMLSLAPFTYGIVIQNDPPFKIPFQDGVLIPTFDYSFYLTAATGGVTLILSVIILIMEFTCPRKIALFFHHSLVDDDSVFQGLDIQEMEEEAEEEGELVRKPSKGSKRSTGSKFRRRETITHSNRHGKRMSVQLESGTSCGRSNIVPRRKSTPAVVSASLVEETESLEMVTVHDSKTADV